MSKDVSIPKRTIRELLRTVDNIEQLLHPKVELREGLTKQEYDNYLNSPKKPLPRDPIRIYLLDEELEALMKKKGTLSWRDFLVRLSY